MDAEIKTDPQVTPDHVAADPPNRILQAWHSPRNRSWAKLLATFFNGQVLTQFIGVLTGFLLLRWMSVESYAQYSVAFAFQSTLNMLVDLGFSGSIVALVGNRGADKQVIGSYVRCARVYRGRIYIILGTCSAIVFPFVTYRQPWGLDTKFLLWIAIIVAVYFQGRLLYGAPLLIHKKLSAYYQAGLLSSGTRLIASAILHFTHLLNGWSAAITSAITVGIQSMMYKRASASLISEPESIDPEKGKEMRRFLAPLWPGTIVFALQSQITTGLITFFGKTQNIAEVGALGRLGQLFAFFSAANIVLIEPLIARTPREVLTKRFTIVVCSCAAIGAVLVILAYIWPLPYEFLLGPNYVSTRYLIGPVIASSALAYLTGVVFIMNTSRKWTFWTTTGAQIAVILICQTYWIVSNRVGTTDGIIWLNVTMASISLCINLLTSVVGLKRT